MGEEQKEREFTIEEMQEISYTLLCDIRQGLANRMIMCHSRKDWSESFVKSTVDSVVNEYIEYVDGIPFRPDINLLSTEQLKSLGFQRWSEDSGVLLVPVWLYQFIEPTLAISIDDESITLDSTFDSRDSRFGCLSCGIIPKDFQRDELGGHSVSDDLKDLK